MSLPVILRPSAEEDVRTTHDDLEQIRAGLGTKFTAQLRDVLERIETFPEVYGVVWNTVRAARLKKLRYVVYYLILSDRVEVLAVLHGARQEATWKRRV